MANIASKIKIGSNTVEDIYIKESTASHTYKPYKIVLKKNGEKITLYQNTTFNITINNPNGHYFAVRNANNLAVIYSGISPSYKVEADRYDKPLEITFGGGGYSVYPVRVLLENSISTILNIEDTFNPPESDIPLKVIVGDYTTKAPSAGDSTAYIECVGDISFTIE